MAQLHRIANHKLIFAIVFVCAAIMSSLFIYHANQKPAASPLIPPEMGLFFPAAREVKPFELIATDKKPFTEKNLYRHWTIIFFGFTHCSSICPLTLEKMKRVYTALRPYHPYFQFVFVSIDPANDTLETMGPYTHAYHPDFIGVTGKIQSIRKLQGQFGIYSGQAPDGSDQLQHTASLILINPQGKWTGLFNQDANAEALTKHLSAIMAARPS